MSEERCIVIGETYKSIYDGLVYRVINIAYCPSTKQMMVVYEEHFGQHRVFVRPYDEFAAETPLNHPRGIDAVYKYKMVECDVNQDGTATVRDCALTEAAKKIKEENGHE